MKNHVRESSSKGNIFIRIAAVMFCLTLFSTYFVTGLFARYSTSGQSGGYARAAKFSIEGSCTLSQGIEADCIPGSTKMVDLTIENNSEVAVEYTVEVANETKNLPLRFRMGAGGPAVTENANGFSFTNQEIPGSHTDTYTLCIDWKAADNDPDYMGKVDYITVTVTATQID